MRVLLALIILMVSACSQAPSSDPILDASVSITNLDGTSGGSGGVLTSSPTFSRILTNAHVCELVKEGAVVNGRFGSALIISYKVYKKHDLCVVTVFQDLHAHLKLSDVPPQTGDYVVSSGHPHLLPTIQQVGRVAGKHIIQVMGHKIKACTEEDLRGPYAILCLFLGGIPEVNRFEAMSLGLLISPGSSGSPVLNKDGDLVGVIFAAAGDPGWAEAVPYEFVKDFLIHLELQSEEFPSTQVRLK